VGQDSTLLEAEKRPPQLVTILDLKIEILYEECQTRNINIPRRSVTTTLSLLPALLALLAKVEFESLTL
jgi:hypothetical protein